MLCCVMLLIVGEPKLLNEETPITGPEIRRRKALSVHTSGATPDNHNARPGFIEAWLANIQFDKQSVCKQHVLNLIKQMFLESSAMLTFLYHKTSVYVTPNGDLILPH